MLVGGEALVDLVLDAAGDLRAHPGGGPFNVARTIGRLGQPVAYLGRVSADRFGATHARLLAEDGVALDAVTRTEDPTTLALAEVDAGGAATYRFYTAGTAAAGLTPEEALAALPEDVALLHVGTLGLVLDPVGAALEAVVERLAGTALVMLDPNVRPGVAGDEAAYRARLDRVLAHSDVVKVSEDDLAWLDPARPAVEAGRAMLAAGPSVVLVTRGADGVVVLTRGGVEEAIAPPPTQVVDTIGAGDAFGGGFAARWRALGLGRAALADPARVLDAARFGALVAARTCERPGASPPHLGELAHAGPGRQEAP